MLKPALRGAAKELAAAGVDTEVIDPRTLVPFDDAAVLASIKKTGHLVICDEARERCSAASEIAAMVADRGWSAEGAGQAWRCRTCASPMRPMPRLA